jgi:hypothetical protein
MHQTSSRLLRMTDDERPYTRVGSFLDSSSNFLVSSSRMGLRMGTRDASTLRILKDTVESSNTDNRSFDLDPFDGSGLQFLGMERQLIVGTPMRTIEGNTLFRPFIRKEWMYQDMSVSNSNWIFALDF